MFKKILVGTLVVGFIGILVAGAMNRTNVKTRSGETRGQGQGRGDTATTYTANGGGRGRGNGNTDQLDAGQAQVAEGLTLQGTVVSVDSNALVVQTSNGEQVIVGNRLWLYALESKFSAQVGDQVTLTGFYQAGAFEVSRIDDLTNGKMVLLHDVTGRPGWAGHGQRGG
jgi:hypothetical protein